MVPTGTTDTSRAEHIDDVFAAWPAPRYQRQNQAAVRGPAVLALLGAAMVVLLIMSLLANGCARVKDETIAGVLIRCPPE